MLIRPFPRPHSESSSGTQEVLGPELRKRRAFNFEKKRGEEPQPRHPSFDNHYNAATEEAEVHLRPRRFPECLRSRSRRSSEAHRSCPRRTIADPSCLESAGSQLPRSPCSWSWSILQYRHGLVL